MIFNSKGVLGINARNLLYIKPYNKTKAIKLADDKIKTKQFLSARGIPVPRLYGIIKKAEEVSKFDFNTLPQSFVIKPNNGFGGEGIIPIVSKRDQYFITASQKVLTRQDLVDHINDILDGRFSISNVSDTAFFEQYIVADDAVGKFSYGGLPDIRVVVHNLIPVMAMLRLPTKESEGKANLHLGAVGVGIDIAKGEVTYTSYKNKIIDELPDGLGSIRGFKIPHWDEILLIASKVQLITNLGYMAIDMCLDRNVGPVMLEINARAGLGVQIANLAPLRRRLERIQGVKVTTPTKGVRIAKDMFGNVVEKEIANLSGKEVIGTLEEIEVIFKKGTFKVMAKVETGQERSVIDEDIAQKAGLLDTEEYEDEKSTLKLKFALKSQRMQTIADVEKIDSEKYKFILGSRDVKRFLIDPSQDGESQQTIYKKVIEPVKNTTSTSVNYREIDKKLNQIDEKIKLLYHLRPLNLEAEEILFFNNTNTNPQFKYPKLKFDPIDLIDSLEKIHSDNSPIGQIFNNKKEEISKKIALLEAIDQPDFSEISIILFGKPTEEEVNACMDSIKSERISGTIVEENIISANEAVIDFQKEFEKYGLTSWKAKVKENMVSDCIAGKNNRLFIKKSATFSKDRIKSLIVHEIETHILTAENGKLQPYEIFNRGLEGYLTTQEGMAMYNVETQRKQPFSKNTKALAHVVAIDTALNGSFSDVYAKLIEIGIPRSQAFRSAVKAKRGLSDTSQPGAFTKDYIYYKGYFQVKKFIENGGELKDLYLGKYNIKDVETVKSINGMIKPVFLPKWL